MGWNPFWAAGTHSKSYTTAADHQEDCPGTGTSQNVVIEAQLKSSLSSCLVPVYGKKVLY